MKKSYTLEGIIGAALAVIGGLFINSKLNSRPRIGDVVMISADKLGVPVTAGAPLSLATVAAVLKGAGGVTQSVRITGIRGDVNNFNAIDGIAGPGIVCFFTRKDIQSMTRNGKPVANPAG